MTERVHDQMPSLIIPAPYCGNCLNAVDFEDGIPYCTTCLIQWNKCDEDATASADTNNFEQAGVPCQTKPSEADVHFTNLPCSIPSGHTGPHHHPRRLRADAPTDTQETG